MCRELFFKVVKGEERADRIKTFPMAALYLAVVPGCIGMDQFVLDAQFSDSFLKKSHSALFATGKTVGKLKTVVNLDTFDPDTLSGIPLHQTL